MFCPVCRQIFSPENVARVLRKNAAEVAENVMRHNALLRREPRFDTAEIDGFQ